jgi:hypothetical protein
MNHREPLVFDGILAEGDLRHLRRTIATMEQPAHSHWFPSGREPQNLIEHVIVCLQKTVLPGSTFAGAEWWFRRELVAVSKRMHFDKDEALARKGLYIHPRLASVLYLTDAGGQTLITDQRCTIDGKTLSPPAPERRVVLAPKQNRYLVFDGALFHGVLPARTGEPAERVTLLINWWDRPLSNASDLQVSTEELGIPRRVEAAHAGPCVDARGSLRACVASPSSGKSSSSDEMISHPECQIPREHRAFVN